MRQISINWLLSLFMITSLAFQANAQTGTTCNDPFNYGNINDVAISGSVSTDEANWYTVVLDKTYTNIAFSLCGSPLDTRIWVYDACNGTELAENDDYDNCGTASQVNFSDLVAGTYVVKIDGWDGNAGEYTLNITGSDPASQSNIMSYSFPEETSASTINETEHSINIEINWQADITNLIANFTLTPSATSTVSGVSQISETTNNNFTNPVIYQVTSPDASNVQDWTITVTQEDQPDPGTDCSTALNYGNINDEAVNAYIDLNVYQWYTVTLDQTYTDVTFSLCGTDLNTRLWVYDACDGTQIGYDNSSCPSNSASLEVIPELAAGTYYVKFEERGQNTAGDYVLTISGSEPSVETNFLTYYNVNQTSETVINTTDHTITLETIYSADNTNFIPEFTLSTGASANIAGDVQESGVTSNDVTSPIIINVIAQDGTTTQDWELTITKAAESTVKDILSFSFAEQTETVVPDVTNHTVDIIVNSCTDLTTLVANFELSFPATASVSNIDQTSGTTENDFSSPVTYTIIAEDGSTQDWTITVSANPEFIINTFPYTESFEDATFPPTCWNNIDTRTVNFYTHSGSKALYINKENSELTTPRISVPSSGVHKISYWYRVDDDWEPQSFNVLLSTDGVNFTETIQSETDYANRTYQEFVYDLSATYAAQDVWVKFVGLTGYGGGDYGLLIDDINIREYNTDATLSDLTIDGATITGFAADVYEYNIELPYGTTAVPTISYTLNSSSSSAIQTNATELPGTTSIVVTADDNSIELTYTVNFTVALNDIATLFYISVDGAVIDNFDSNTLEYTNELPYGTTTIPVVSYILDDENATAVQTDATELPGATTIVVTSEDGSIELTYTVNFTIEANTIATLSDLIIDGATITDFASNVYVYNVELAYGTTTVPTINYTLTDENANAVKTDATELPGTTTIDVTAEDGTTDLTYTVNFTNTAANTIATLSDLTIDGLTITDFASNIYVYNVELAYGTTTVPTIDYALTDENANAVQSDATELPSATTISVTAEDGTTDLTYTVNFTFAANTTATLSDLTIDGATITDFASNVYVYNVELAYGTTTVPTIDYALTDENANAVKTDATELPSATTIVVTAEDGTTDLTYTVSFTITAANTTATLSDLTVDGATITDFVEDTYVYNVELASGTTSIPTIDYVLTDENSNAVQTDATELPGATTIIVTAEDGTTELTYTVNFTVLTGISTVINEKDINVYPNPTNGIFKIDLNLDINTVNIDIVNMQGITIKQLNSVNAKSIQSINLTGVPNGIYYIKISDSNNIITKKVNIIN